MNVFAGSLGVGALVIAVVLLVIGTPAFLVGPIHGPNWMAEAIILWIVIGLGLLGTFAILCANAIDKARGV